MIRRVVTVLMLLCVGGMIRAGELALTPLPASDVPAVLLLVGNQCYAIGACRLIQTGGQTIIVVVGAPTPAPPGPLPDPLPVPPIPTPIPGPPPAPSPADPFQDAVKAAYALVGASGRQHASTIAGVYSGLAGEVEAAPAGWTVSRLVAEARIRVATDLPLESFADWRPFWAGLAEAVTALKLEDGDVSKAIAAFRTVAQSLEGK